MPMSTVRTSWRADDNDNGDGGGYGGDEIYFQAASASGSDDAATAFTCAQTHFSLWKQMLANGQSHSQSK